MSAAVSVTDPARLSLHEAASAIVAGTLSSVALVQALLARIDQRDTAVRAWAHLDRAQLLAAARAADAAPRRGPLHGLPIALKDIIDTVDMPTRYGSPLYRDHRPARDAALVQLLKAAGAIVMGKTVTTEFAYFTPGATTNPHNKNHTPGGSSSGSAAAVADYQAPAALGTQTAGSVIRPASFCGVIGYKPVFDTIPTAGVHPFAPALDTLGLFVRALADIPLLMTTLSDRPWPAAEPAAAPRIALFRGPYWDAAEAAARAELEGIAARLAAAGATVREMAVPAGLQDLGDAHAVLNAVGGAQTHERHWRLHRAQLSARLRELIARGQALTPAHLEVALATATHWRKSFSSYVAPGEIILTPSACGEAPAGLESTGDPIFNILWTTLRVPALHLPTGRGPRGLPLGVQLVAPDSDDGNLLRAATWIADRMKLAIAVADRL